MRLSDRELLLVAMASLLTWAATHDVSTTAHRIIGRAAARQSLDEVAEHHLGAAVDGALGSGSHRRIATDLYTLGRLHRKNGDLAASERQLRRALELFAGDPVAHTEMRARILLGLVEVSHAAGLPAQARADAEALVALTEHAFGSEDLRVANALEALARVHGRAESLELAERAWRRALSIREAALGGGDPAVGATMVGLGQLLRTRGRLEPAELYLERGIHILEQPEDPGILAWWRAVGPFFDAPSSHVLNAQNELALTYRDQGRLLEADETFRRALEIASQSGSPTERASILSNASMVLLRLGRLEEAVRYSEDALSIAETAVLSPKLRASLHGNMANAYAAHQRRGAARDHLEAAAALVGSLPRQGDPLARATLANISNVSGLEAF